MKNSASTERQRNETFLLTYFDKGLDHVFPWIAGMVLAFDSDQSSGWCTRFKYREILGADCPAIDLSDYKRGATFSTQDILNNFLIGIGLRTDDTVVRLFELDNFTVFESNVDFNTSIFPLELVSHFAGCNFYYMRDTKIYEEQRLLYEATEFRALSGGGKLRSVSVNFDKSWSFEEFGSPLPLEDVDAYQVQTPQDRLDLQRLLDYASRTGLGIDKVMKRKFGKAVEFSSSKDGRTVREFVEIAEKFAAFPDGGNMFSAELEQEARSKWPL